MNAKHRTAVLMMLTVPLLHCGGGAKEPPTSTLVLFDFSMSRPADITGRYTAAVRELLSQIKEKNDRVTFAVIQVPVEFTQFNVSAELDYPNDNYRARKIFRDTVLAQTARRVDTLLASTGRTKQSPLVDVFPIAAEYMKSREGYEHHLVVYTDGVHQTAGFDIADSVPTEQLITQLEAQDKIPDLSGVRVRIVLAIGGTYDTLPDEHRVAIRRFWKAYVEAAGGTLEYYGA
jgi:hypothetical protein